MSNLWSFDALHRAKKQLDFTVTGIHALHESSVKKNILRFWVWYRAFVLKNHTYHEQKLWIRIQLFVNYVTFKNFRIIDIEKANEINV